MTESMNQLIPIFEDIIKANNFITFAYSSLDDRWFCLLYTSPSPRDCS